MYLRRAGQGEPEGDLAGVRTRRRSAAFSGYVFSSMDEWAVATRSRAEYVAESGPCPGRLLDISFHLFKNMSGGRRPTPRISQVLRVT